MTKYRIWSEEKKLWWAPGSYGYEERVQDAGQFTEDDALAICLKSQRGRGPGDAPNAVMMRVDEAEAWEQKRRQLDARDAAGQDAANFVE